MHVLRLILVLDYTADSLHIRCQALSSGITWEINPLTHLVVLGDLDRRSLVSLGNFVYARSRCRDVFTGTSLRFWDAG